MSCPTDYSPLVVAPEKSWSNFFVVTALVVDSKSGIVDDWSAKEWREFCQPSRRNEAPQPEISSVEICPMNRRLAIGLAFLALGLSASCLGAERQQAVVIRAGQL